VFAVPRDTDSTTDHAIPDLYYLSAADLELVNDLCRVLAGFYIFQE
jgi:hypothetical protein